MSATAHTISAQPNPTAIPPRGNVTPLIAAATISTADGRFVTGGIATIDGGSDAWTAVLRHLDRPGIVATLYFSEGTRDVILRLEDGRRARARIASTSFTAGSQRICELTGLDPLT